MGQYKVKHQCDKTCADCGYYERFDREDSFGPAKDEYCGKGRYDHVGQNSDACDSFRDKNDMLDNLTRDVLAAERAGMSYGQWKALHPNTKKDWEPIQWDTV